jgi:tetratricopeptide (TPR) repeat protein
MMAVAGFACASCAPAWARLMPGDRGYSSEEQMVRQEPATIAASSKIFATYMEPAERAQKQGKPDEAIALQEGAIAAWNTLPDTAYRSSMLRQSFLTIAQIYENQNRWDKVEQTHRQLAAVFDGIEFAPDGIAIARACVKQQKYKEAESVYRQLIKGTKRDDQAYCYRELVAVFAAQKQFDQEEKTLKDFLDDANQLHKPKLVRSARLAYATFLKERGRQVEAAQVDQQLVDKHCPICGSDAAVQPIEYGCFGRPKQGITQGGGIAFSDSPRWFCTNDNTPF